jgi:6-phosphofructokinase 1
MKEMKAAIAQGGGPTAVINASLFGAVQELVASGEDARVWGAEGGIAGVLRERWLDLNRPDAARWAEIANAPGAALGSCRKMLSAEEAEAAVRILKSADIRYFFYIGGNDSMDTAMKMARAAESLRYELHVAGIPKTVDNDLPGTDHCPGFGSAARYFAQTAIDLGTDIRSLPPPVTILETMGRNTGWLAAATIAARAEEDDAPHLIYVPEAPLAADRFLEDVQAVYDRLGWVVVAVSEGVTDEKGESWSTAGGGVAVDGFGHPLPGDVAANLASAVKNRLGLRARSEKPGLCGRACSLMVSPVDRAEAEAVGRFAATRALAGSTGFMASIERTSSRPYAAGCRCVPLADVANVEKFLPAGYVAERGNDIEESYREYVEPLLGGPLRRYARLR